MILSIDRGTLGLLVMVRIDDAVLVKRFQEGDRNAFDEIDQRYRSRICRFLFLRLKSQELAEELTQETFVRALNKLYRLQHGRFLSPWLYRIAYNCFIDWTRHNRSELAHPVSYDDWGSGGDADENCNSNVFSGNERRLNGHNIIEPSPDTLAERKEERDNLWRIALDILTDDEYRILWMRYAEELSEEEIAYNVGKRIGTVRVSLSRIRKKLLKRTSKSNDP